MHPVYIKIERKLCALVEHIDYRIAKCGNLFFLAVFKCRKCQYFLCVRAYICPLRFGGIFVKANRLPNVAVSHLFCIKQVVIAAVCFIRRISRVCIRFFRPQVYDIVCRARVPFCIDKHGTIDGRIRKIEGFRIAFIRIPTIKHITHALRVGRHVRRKTHRTRLRLNLRSVGHENRQRNVFCFGNKRDVAVHRVGKRIRRVRALQCPVQEFLPIRNRRHSVRLGSNFALCNFKHFKLTAVCIQICHKNIVIKFGCKRDIAFHKAVCTEGYFLSIYIPTDKRLAALCAGRCGKVRKCFRFHLVCLIYCAVYHIGNGVRLFYRRRGGYFRRMGCKTGGRIVRYRRIRFLCHCFKSSIQFQLACHGTTVKRVSCVCVFFKPPFERHAFRCAWLCYRAGHTGSILNLHMLELVPFRIIEENVVCHRYFSISRFFAGYGFHLCRLQFRIFKNYIIGIAGKAWSDPHYHTQAQRNHDQKRDPAP